MRREDLNNKIKNTEKIREAKPKIEKMMHGERAGKSVQKISKK